MLTNQERLRVLVVDDEEVIANSLTLIIRSQGHEVRAVYNAAEAIASAEESSPDVLISDVVMPGLNGIELSTYFATHWPACRVLLMSGNASTTGLLEDARRHGHELEFIAKPVPPQDILNFLGNIRKERIA